MLLLRMGTDRCKNFLSAHEWGVESIKSHKMSSYAHNTALVFIKRRGGGSIPRPKSLSCRQRLSPQQQGIKAGAGAAGVRSAEAWAPVR